MGLMGKMSGGVAAVWTSTVSKNCETRRLGSMGRSMAFSLLSAASHGTRTPR